MLLRTALGAALLMWGTSAARIDAAEAMDGCPEAIVVTFGDAAGTACRIAACESRWDNRAIGGAGEVSMFQIHPVWFGRYDRQRLRDDEWYAAQVAYEMSAGGTNWRPWSCR